MGISIFPVPSASATIANNTINYLVTSQSVYGSGTVATYTTPGTYSWTAPAGVTSCRVRVIGGGGSGGWQYSGSNGRATGGGGGGYADKVFTVVPGTSYSLTVGAGGLSPTSTSNSNGNNGGTSSFNGVISATGGSGGTTSTTLNSSVSGGAGGSGTGGDINYTGGRGGNAGAISGSSVGSCQATGGGAAAWLTGNGFNGGDILGFGGVNTYYRYGTGGGSRFANGGEVNPATYPDNRGTGGGGYLAPSQNSLNGGAALDGSVATGTSSDASGSNGATGTGIVPRFSGDIAVGGGGGAAYGSSTTARSAGNGGPGAGGGGFVSASVGGVHVAGDGGALGGGGGLGGSNGSSSASGTRAGNGGIGGGGGGLGLGVASTQVRAGNGGNGIVIIEY